MEKLINSEIFMLTITVGSYFGGQWLYRKSNIKLLHPIITSVATIIAILILLDIPSDSYREGSHFIHFLLGPSVVALGYLLYEELHHIKGNLVSLLVALLAGSLVGIISVIWICRWLGADPTIIASLQPKSVTTPIAIGLSARSGGLPALTAIVVVLCGILGSIAGPWLLKKLGVKSKVAKGLALGAASHGIGTARALEIGTLEGAVSGMAIGLMGIITAILIPLLERWV